MSKKLDKYVNQHKARFHRSRPKLIRGKAVKRIFESTHGPLVKDLCTKWKTPISEETFNELLEKDALSLEQIKQYNKGREKGSDLSRIKRHEHFSIIAEIAKHDLSTIEGLLALKGIIEKHPEAVQLLKEAQKLRSQNQE